MRTANSNYVWMFVFPFALGALVGCKSQKLDDRAKAVILRNETLAVRSFVLDPNSYIRGLSINLLAIIEFEDSQDIDKIIGYFDFHLVDSTSDVYNRGKSQMDSISPPFPDAEIYQFLDVSDDSLEIVQSFRVIYVYRDRKIVMYRYWKP